MQTVFNIISGITISGFSSLAEYVISMLKIPQSVANIKPLEILAWIIMLFIAIGPKKLIECLDYVGKSMILKIHPNAIVSYKRKGHTRSKEEIEQYGISVISTIAVMLFTAFILSFEATGFEDAMLTALAIVSNFAWPLLLIEKTALLSTYSFGMQAFICLMLILCRIRQIRKILKK